MFRSILKFTAIATVGAVVFTSAAFFMDKDVLEQVEQEIINKRAALVTAGTPELLTELSLYVGQRRAEWVSKLVFAASLDDLDRLIEKLLK